MSAERAEQPPSWEQLFGDHFDACYRLIRRNGVLEADAEDLAQRVFVIAHRKLSRGERVLVVGAWLRRITLNVVREHMRWCRVRRLMDWHLPFTPGAKPRASRPPEALASQLQERDLICEVLGSMSPKLRETLVLIEIEGLKPREVAAELEISVNTVRSRHRLAVADFRKRWTRYDTGGEYVR